MLFMKIKRTLITEQEIERKIKEYGKLISREYEGKNLLLIGILKGSFVFMADLCRAIDIPVRVDFLSASSYYSGISSSGEVKIKLDISQERDLSDTHVIIAEDIIDTGRTLKDISQLLNQRNPLSLKVVTLLDKPSRRAVNFNADWSLFTIPDVFVVGFGLDYDENYRNLPYIAELE
ncbi:MAG: hypoxanthine phosphoribosyltransferase [Ruminococcus sp.]|nr:hypoxanthine phosphoribosyltransferase [Ruminococcus sp.]